MSTHEGVSCDACSESNFSGKRYKCLQCFDYDLCAQCYEAKATTARHLNTHPMQCLHTINHMSMFYSGEQARKQSWSYTCPICGEKGLSEETMTAHVNEKHPNDFTEVICPICASVPGVEPNQMVEYFVNHMNSNIHQNCDENSAVRIRQRIRGTSSNRHRRSQFTSHSSSAMSAGSGAATSGSGISRESQLGTMAQFLTQFSDSRFIRSYAPGQQTLTHSTNRSQQGSSNGDRFAVPKWGNMRSIYDEPWEGRKAESFASKLLGRKDDTPWLRNPPSNPTDEQSEEVSIFEMDRSVFVTQLLLSTLSLEVPLHGTDPVPKRELFEEASPDALDSGSGANAMRNATAMGGGKSKLAASVKYSSSSSSASAAAAANTDNFKGDNIANYADDDDDSAGSVGDDDEELSDDELDDNVNNSNGDDVVRDARRQQRRQLTNTTKANQANSCDAAKSQRSSGGTFKQSLQTVSQRKAATSAASKKEFYSTKK